MTYSSGSWRSSSSISGHLSALQRQFDLDEAYLEDLKAEIIEARQLAVDEGGRVLVWTGAAGTAPASALPLPQAALSASALEDSPPHDAPSQPPMPRGRTPAAHGAVL